MRNTFVDVIIDECIQHDDIFIITGDAGLGVFDDFQKKRPDRFLNLGIAEQNTIGCAAGLALAGFRVYVYNITPFVLYRCYEQVRNDICYQNLPVTLVGIGSGLTYAPMGMTHYSVEDLGITQTLPNLRVFSPTDPIEAKLAALATLSGECPTYVRLAKRGEPNVHNNTELDITKPLCLTEGSEVAIVFHGTMANEVLEARKILNERGVSAKIISIPLISPCPIDILDSMLSNIHHVVTVEEHFIDSGLGARIAYWSATHRPKWRLSCLGIKPKFIHEIKKQSSMRKHFGISAEQIASHVLNLFNK